MAIELKQEYFVKCANGPRMGEKDEHGNLRLEYVFEYIEEPTDDLKYDGDGHIDDIPFHFYLAPSCGWVMLSAARGIWLEAQVCEIFPDDCQDEE